MSILPILRWPDERLQSTCAPVTGDVRQLAEDMLETMYAAPGRGLAAPQVGVMQRLFVMDETWKEGTPAPMVFVNPEIVAQSDDTVTQPEGCLSIPGVLVDVTRPSAVTLRWKSLSGVIQEERFNGFAAACVQHELDHLNGLVTFDRIEAEARAQALAEYTA